MGKQEAKDFAEASRRFMGVHLIADSEIRAAAFRVLLATPTTSPELFGKRCARVFTEARADLDRMSCARPTSAKTRKGRGSRG